MKIKRYFAPDIRRAIRMVREEQGQEAVILSNRQIEGGVEIVAAIDYDERLLSNEDVTSKTSDHTSDNASKGESGTRPRGVGAYARLKQEQGDKREWQAQVSDDAN